ncbi:hypothetical protein M422DRAFT_155463, partial [Sphaerobolus stellatus SS14]
MDVNLGKNWMRRFLARYPELNARWRRRIDRHRAMAVNADSINHFFDLLQKIIDKHDLKPEQVFNMDEKGCMLDIIQGARVLSLQMNLSVGRLDGNRESVTIIECICADGSSIPPTYIFKGKNLQSTWFENDPINANYSTSPNGWTDNELGVYWLEKVFNQATAAKSSKPRLLILDGHSSHISYEFVDFARQHNIELLCLPSHSTADLQPLDVAIFGPLSHAWSNEVEVHSSTGLSVTKSDFCGLYAAARARAFSRKLVLKAFEATGIQPFDRTRL